METLTLTLVGVGDSQLVFDRGAAAVCDGKGRHKSWLQQWLQSWIRSLQSKRVDSVVVSCKLYTP
jgi:hypothetical protein